MNAPDLPGVSLTFLYYFSTTASIALLVLSQGLGLGFENAIAYQAASGLGLLVGIMGTLQNRSVTRQLSFKKRAEAKSRLIAALTDLGFAEQEPWQEYTVYCKPQGWGRGKVRVFLKWEPKSVAIAGRAHLIRQLQSQLADLSIPKN